jgi:MFS family permease
MSRIELSLFVNAAHFLTHYALLILPTAALAIAPAWGMSFADVMLTGSPLYAAFALGTLPAGWLGDRVDRLALIAVFYLGIGAASVGISLTDGPTGLAIGLGALGLFAAIYHPVGLALLAEGGTRAGRALAVNGVFGNLGLAGAAAATGVLAQAWGWQAAFAVPGGASLLLGVLLLARAGLRGDRRHTAGTVAAPGPVDRSQEKTVFAVVCVSALLGGLIFNLVTIALPKFLDERLARDGTDLAWIGLSTGLVFAVAAVAQLPVGELLDRIGARPVLSALLAAQAVLFLALSQAAGWAALALALLAVTCLFAEIPITTWLLGRHLAPGIRSRAISVEYTLSLGVGSVAAPLLALLHGAGIGFSVQFVGLALCAGVVLVAARRLPAPA